jgi:hypothetical protein
MPSGDGRSVDADQIGRDCGGRLIPFPTLRSRAARSKAVARSLETAAARPGFTRRFPMTGISDFVQQGGNFLARHRKALLIGCPRGPSLEAGLGRSLPTG